MPITDMNQTMRTPRYGAIGVNPVPVPGTMPGQAPSGFPQNMGIVQQSGQPVTSMPVPDSIASAKPPIVSPVPQPPPMQSAPQPNGSQAANQKMYNANSKAVLDKNQMSGAINRRITKQNG